MSANDLFIAVQDFKHGSSYREICTSRRLSKQDATELAVYLCDTYGTERVFPPKLSVYKREKLARLEELAHAC